MDVKSDFIHGDIHEEIHMQQIKGFIHDPSLIFRLNKSLYGLKQAPRAWYAKMEKIMLSLGFEIWKYDPNFYLKNIGHVLQFILLYVYDIFITGSCIK